MTSSVTADNPVFLEKLRRMFRNASWLGFAQLGGLAVSLLLAEIIRMKKNPFLGILSSSLTPESRPVLRAVFFAAAVAALLLLRLIHGRNIRRIGAAADRLAAADGLFGLAVTDLVLAEVPAVLGLALFLTGGYNRDFYVLLFVSLFLLFIYFPRLKNWEDILERRPTCCPR